MNEHLRPGPGGDWDHDHAACQQVREEAVVGLLTRTEPSRAVLAHLQACPTCHAEYRQLAVLPPLLGHVRDVTSHPPPTPSPLLLERLLTHLARRRRRRRAMLAVTLTAAAVAAVLPLLPLGGGSAPTTGSVAVRSVGRSADRSTNTSRQAPGEPVNSGLGPPSGVTRPPGVAAAGASLGGPARVRVWVWPMGAGSMVTVRVAASKAVPSGGRCRLVLHDASGGSTVAGTWTIRAPESSYSEEVGMAPTEIRTIELVEDTTGRHIMNVSVVSL